jgi:hypothetical protein
MKTIININGTPFHARYIDETHIALHINEDKLDYPHASVYNVGQFQGEVLEQVEAFINKASRT